MGYNIEISVNMQKETNFSEMERNIKDMAIFYSCNSLYVSSEEDGTTKIPKYHCIFVVNFLEENFDNFIKFVKFMKICKSTHIECIYYDDNICKLMYASTYYLKNIDKNASKKYKQFINDKNFTPNELKLLREFRC